MSAHLEVLHSEQQKLFAKEQGKGNPRDVNLMGVFFKHIPPTSRREEIHFEEDAERA